ncbi:uncharacterized protein TRUGW13939_01835 [Talaromyces rugulosus]|uniref:Uncharacterized protein n=1 Tax=Talaromyces rugulosus TaxID=121627 RepID=A0A7H8QLH2_TALRU|nr:uncharacterized protein TRUGW13939_01835 [Talaromyces rugulosus]QKX54746.1 hypothetical protein TRUGW13939_01835 [Talaromyces rugulosus]
MRRVSRLLAGMRRFMLLNATCPDNSPTVSWILKHRSKYVGQFGLRKGNTPTESLYLMYEYIVAGWTVGLRNEIEYFFNQSSWAVSAIPDPKDPDPERYAILAVLPYYLTRAFNRLIERGIPRDCPAIITSEEMEDELRARPKVLEKEPSWVEQVPSLEQTLIIPDDNGEVPPERDRSEQFLRKKVIMEEPHTLFV